MKRIARKPNPSSTPAAAPALSFGARPPITTASAAALKNALDFLELTANDDPPYLGGRLVGLVAASSGPIAAVQAINAMEQIVHALRGYVVPATAPIGPIERAIDRATGRITDARTQLKLTELADEMRDALTTS